MIFDLEPDTYDKDMIRAHYRYTNKAGKTQFLLAFVIHIDCIEDDSVLADLREHGESSIEMRHVYGD